MSETTDTPPPAQALPRVQTGTSNVKLMALLILIVCGCGGALAFLLGSPTAPERPNATRAGIICEQLVGDRLRVPSTARFHLNGNHHLLLSGRVDAWRVIGYVDAQNSSGAMIRSYYTCDIQYDGGDWKAKANWTLLDLQIE